MTFGTLVVAALGRNPLRSAFTFVAIAAAFCLFGALETSLYQRDLPPGDADLVVAQVDGNTMFALSAEEEVASIEGVASAVGLLAMGVQSPKTPAQTLFVMGLNHLAVPTTLRGMEISRELSARWSEAHDGAVCDDDTAREMGWRVNDHLALALLPGMTTGSGSTTFEVTLVGLYPSGSLLSGLVVRADYYKQAFPRFLGLSTFFVRPERASEGRAVAQRIDEHFRGSRAQSMSAPISDFRAAALDDAATIRLAMIGGLITSFLTMVLIVANALMQSVRERTGELAVMQALGFEQRTILFMVLAEALLLFAAGAFVGLVAANLAFTFEIAGTLRRSALLPAHTVLTAVAYVLLFAVFTAALPCWEISRLRVADALRRL